MSPDALPSRLASFRRAYLSPVLFILLIVQIAFGAVWLAFTFPVQIDLSFPEGALVAGAREAAMGRSPYQDWREWPHVFAPYAPLTYCGVGAAARLAGRPDDARFIYLLGRAQSLGALFGICLLIALMTAKHKPGEARTTLWGAVAVALFFLWGSPMIAGSGSLLSFVASYRPDAPQVFFSLLALAIALKGEPTPLRTASAFGALFIAMWFKPTAWGMTAALAVWVARGRGPKIAAICVAAFGVAGLAAGAVLNHTLDGRLFLNMIASLDNGWRPSNLLQFYARLEPLPLLVLIGALLAAAFDPSLRRSSKENSILPLAFLASFAATSLQNLKVGADINYYLEPYALACALCAWALARAWHAGQLRPSFELALGALLPAFYLAFWVPAMLAAPSNLADLKRSWQPLPLARYVASVKGEILASNPFLALARPAPPTIMDHVQYGILVERGILSDEALIDRARRRAFALVIFPAPEMEKPAFENASLARLYSPRLLPELRENYEEFQRAGVLVLLRPKQDP